MNEDRPLCDVCSDQTCMLCDDNGRVIPKAAKTVAFEAVEVSVWRSGRDGKLCIEITGPKEQERNMRVWLNEERIHGE